MKSLRAALAKLPAYLWSGWGAVASLLLLVAAWEAVAQFYGPLVLPDPRSAFATLAHSLAAGEAGPHGARWPATRCRWPPAARSGCWPASR